MRQERRKEARGVTSVDLVGSESSVEDKTGDLFLSALYLVPLLALESPSKKCQNATQV